MQLNITFLISMKKFYRLLVNSLCVEVDGGPLHGTYYNMDNACKQCGSGAEPEGPRYMSNIEKIKKRITTAGFGEVLIDVELAQKCIDNGIKCLAPVLSAKSKERSSYMEIRGEAVLPPFSTKTIGYEISKKQCSICKRDGYFDSLEQNLKLIYENLGASILKNDILITFERFGYSRLREPFKDSVFARPLYIVSDKLSDILQESAVKGVDFDPIIIT